MSGIDLRHSGGTLKRTRLAVIFCLASTAGGLQLTVPAPARANDKLPAGTAMPDFSLPRGDGTSGNYGLGQLKGAPAAIVFWRLNQKMSLDALHELQATLSELGAGKFRIVAVEASRATTAQVQAALSGEKLSFPVVVDPQRELYGKIGVIVCPTTLLLDAGGMLRFTVAGRPPQYAQVIRSRLRFLLGALTEQQMNKEIEPTILKIDHDVAAGWRMYNLGMKLQAEGRADQALAVFEKAVSEHPALPEARCALGFMKLAAGEWEVAAQHFQAALTHDPASPSARLGQAAVLARTGQPQQAEQILLSLVGQKAIAVRVRYELGRLYRARGELEKANAYFEDALASVFPEGDAATPPNPPFERGGRGGSASQSSGAGPAGTARSEPAAQAPTAPVANAGSAGAAVVPGAPKPAGAPLPSNIRPVAFPSDAQFLGVKSCKKCHLQQWKSWQETRMAQAFDLLKPAARADVKTARKLDPQKDYTTDSSCLACHSNGGGIAGGYRTPSPGDEAAAGAAQENACVGCESCHGPGNKFVPIHKDIQDKQRKYTQAELYQAGQFKVDMQVCARCHDPGRAPCVGPGYVFDFEQRKTQGTHKHFDLNFRTP